jgi:putative DNA primase/helicase
MPPDDGQPTNEQRLSEAKARVEPLLKQPKLTAAEVFVKEILEALVWIEAGDFNDFVKIKEQLKRHKISSKDLVRAMKPYQPTLRVVHEGDDAEKVASDFLSDAPLPDLIIPSPYTLDDRATYRMVEDANGVPHPLAIAYAPVLITGRLQSIEDGGQWLRLAWKRGQSWLHLDVDRGVAMNATKLLELASQGFPIATDNAAHVTHYLHELEAVNYQTIPTAQMATRLGWQGEQGAYGFLCGRTLSRAEEILMIDDLSSVKTTQWQEKWIAFHGAGGGDEQIVNGFHQRGTYEAWCDAVKTVIPYPSVRLGLYASLAVPLLEILHVPNFVIDWSARTSVGKTNAVRVVASPWGCPDELRVGESIVFSWHATKVWSERAAAVMNGLPFILDESKLAKKGDVPSVLYMVANGIGKGRGNLKGLAVSKRWRTILFSTGESPITSFSEDGGSRMRCLCVRGYPFGGKNEELLKFVNELKMNLCLNYGHAGPRFTQWLLQHRDRWGDWEKRYAAHKRALLELIHDDAGYRLSDYGAVIQLAAELAHEALSLPWDQPKAITDELWGGIVGEAAGAAGEVRALRDVMSWAYANQESFFGRESSDQHGNPRVPHSGWAGKWNNGDQWNEIAFFPTVLKQVLSDFGYDPEAILSLWNEEGWLVRNERGRNLGKHTHIPEKYLEIPGGKAYLITLDRISIECVMG